MLSMTKPFAIILLMLVCVSIDFAQGQRMAIAPSGPITIGPGREVSVPSYCLDEFRDPPSNTPLPFVLTPEANATVKIGDKSLTLQEAIQQGILTVTGGDWYSRISIVSNVSSEMQVGFAGPVVLSEALEPLKGLQLNNVRTPRANETQYMVQHAVWADNKQLLDAILRQLMPQARGDVESRYYSYLDNKVGDLSQPHAAAMSLLFGNDVTAIQQDLKGLGLYAGAVDGIDGANTQAAVKAFQLASGLPQTGLITPQLKSEIERRALASIGFKAENLETAVRQFQQYSKLNVTGTLDSKTRASLSSDLGYLRFLLQATSPKRTTRDIFARNQILVQRAAGETIAVMPHELPTLKAWVISDREVKARLTGDAVFEKLDESLRKEISTRSLANSTVTFLHAGSIANQSGTSTIQFGQSSVPLTVDQLKQLLASDSQPLAALDKLFPDRSTAGNRQKVLIVRDAIREMSSDRATPDGTSRYWSAGLSKYYGFGDRLRPDPRKLLVALRERYGKYGYDFFLDGAMDPSVQNVESLPHVSGPGDVAIYIAPESFSVTDRGVVNQIKSVVNQHSIRVVEKIEPVAEQSIIAISAHKGSDLIDYLEELGRKDCLRGKFVVLFSCFGPEDEAIISRLIAKHGAKAVYAFPHRLDVQAVADVMAEFVQLTGSLNGRTVTVDQLIRESIEKAASDTDAGTHKDNIVLLRNGLPHVSER